MPTEQVVGATRFDSLANGQDSKHILTGRKGGSNCKVASAHARVHNTGNANTRVTVELWHSPDGSDPVLHSVCINAVDPGSTFPKLLVGDADTTKIIGEYLHWVIKVKDSATTNPMWAVVELFETRKPF